ncbi:MAG: Hsp33 family molecular chaperone HslO [Gammaproteobacteria bacterium]|nr:MAG: Hsp33 family molecular chaperone HslO [Gammaproteobacteria bacterium]
MSQPEHDTLHRFIIEHTHVRGEWVHLDATWQAILERGPYPPGVRQVLGEALAAVALLSATIKFDGSLILQITGDGPISMLVMQADGRRALRGLAHWEGEVPEEDLQAQFGNGRMVITIDPGEGKERYQGVVALEGRHLSDALDHYFARSEQLSTRLWLAVSEESVAGLLLQRLPGEDEDADAWDRTVALADTVSEEELLSLPVEELLHRLFHEEDVRLFEREPMCFRCSCSEQRVRDMIRNLGSEEAQQILAEEGGIHVTCEFCNAQYHFDSVDIDALFAEGAMPGDRTRH